MYRLGSDWQFVRLKAFGQSFAKKGAHLFSCGFEQFIFNLVSRSGQFTDSIKNL